MAFEELNTRVNGSQLQANLGNEVLLVGKGMQVRLLQTCQPQMGQLIDHCCDCCQLSLIESNTLIELSEI